MKTTLFALMLMAGSAFAQNPYPADQNGGAPNYDPSYGQQGQGPYAQQGQGPYAQQGPDPNTVDPRVGGPGNYPQAGGYGAPEGVYTGAPNCGPGSVWIDGYTDANGFFVNGYCTVPPFAGAYWIAPGFFGGRFVAGYWGHGGVGFGPRFGVRGGFTPGYAVRGGYNGGFNAGSHFAPGNGFHAPAAAPAFHPQGGFHGGAPAMRGGGAGHGGRR